MLRPTYYIPPVYVGRPSVTLCLLCVRAVTTPQRWLIRPTYNTWWLLSSLFLFDLPIEDQPPLACFRTVTRPQWWMLRPAYYTPSICRAPLCYTLPPLRPCCVTTPQRWMIRPTCNTCWLLSSLFPFDLPIEDQPPQATWPCCGFGRSWCANVRRCRIHPSQRQSSAAFPLLSGPACAKLVPFPGMSLLPALLPCCDKATMVDATAHLLYPQYM